MNSEIEQIGPGYLRADLTNTMQLHSIIASIIEQIGKSKVTVVTFSISEEFIRKMWLLKSAGKIESVDLYLDFKAAQKTRKIMQFASNVFDSINYCRIHAKIVIIDSATISACITGSQNATRGNRMESILITTQDEIISTFRERISCLQTINL